MKFYIILIASACLVLLPWSAFNNSIDAAVAADEQSATAVNAPGVAPPLVREGDFAVKLVDALSLMTGSPQDEAAAEGTLASMDIAPENGWIADYPVTPLIITQLQKSIQDAVDSDSLAMSSASAMEALQTVSDDFNLNIVAAGSGENKDAGELATGSSANVSPAELENYYHDNRPPVITYYSPPSAFVYLYTWVPCPFWSADLYFPGYFILNDFDTYVIVHHRKAICSNHVFSRRTGHFFLVHPVDGRFYRLEREFSHVNRSEIRRHDRRLDHHDGEHRDHDWEHRDHDRAHRDHDGTYGRRFENRTFHHEVTEGDSLRPGYAERSPRPVFEYARPQMGNFDHRGAPEGFHGAHSGRISNSTRGH
jgi:hypothetical protein